MHILVVIYNCCLHFSTSFCVVTWLQFDVLSHCHWLAIQSSDWLEDRDGPKFGRRQSLAEEFGRMFGSVRLGNM